jgi:hypothetical protein
MNLIEKFQGHHLFEVSIQEDGELPFEELEEDDLSLLDDVLGAFQKGDAQCLSDLAHDLEEENWKKYEDEVIMLRRLHNAAQAMEEP